MSRIIAILIGAIIGGLAMAIPLARLRRRVWEREERAQQMAEDRQRVIEFMHHMAEALGEGLSVSDLRQRIVHASILCTGALSACFFERTAAGIMRGVAVEGLFPPHRKLGDSASRGPYQTRAKFIAEVLKSEEFPVGDGIVGRVAHTGRAELIADAASDPLIVKHDDPALAVRSVIAVPLAFRDQFFGVLAVANPAASRPFTRVEFTLLQSLGEQAAVALHNAELLNLQIEKSQMDLDLSIASGIQQMLLPRSPRAIAGLDLDARYIPAQKVGGDLYDVIPLSERRLGVAVADVSGKGIPASLLMAIARTNLRQIALRYQSPARVLVELNRAIAEDMRAGLYITMLYAVIDVERGTLTFARAGHELPLVGRHDPAAGSFHPRFIGSDGMPVGMVGDELFSAVLTDHTEVFLPGHVLVLYTDGVTEAPNEDQREFSAARLADAVRALHAREAKAINEGILEAVQRFTGDAPQYDDITLVTIKRV